MKNNSFHSNVGYNRVCEHHTRLFCMSGEMMDLLNTRKSKTIWPKLKGVGGGDIKGFTVHCVSGNANLCSLIRIIRLEAKA